MTTAPAFNSGTGRRKTAVARVRLIAGRGRDRRQRPHRSRSTSATPIDQSDILMPFRVTNTEGRFNAMIKVEGGGVTGQAGAIRHGIARALLELDPEALGCPAPGRLPDPRPADEGTQEVRPQARPQGAAVHEALVAPAGRSRRA